MSNTPKKPSLGKLSLKRESAPTEAPRLEERLHKVLAQAGLRVVARDIHREQGVSNSGAVVDKQFHVLVCAHA